MAEIFDRIRILALEDEPDRLRDDKREGRPPQLPAELTSLFEMRWLASPGEARDFRDLFRRLSLDDPICLGTHGWVPEVFAIDYMLRDGVKFFQDSRIENQFELTQVELERLSALAMLQKLAGARVRVERSDHGRDPEPESMGEDVAGHPDKSGCLIGGLLATSFSDHPCAIVASTVHSPDTVKGSYAWLVEWAMDDETSGQLRCGKKFPAWREIITTAVPLLRRRIVQLAVAGVIDVAPEDLWNLAEGRPQSILRLHSRFGSRRLPVKGLFFDNPDEAKDWATSLATTLFGTPPAALAADIDAAKALTEHVWKAYNNKTLVKDRLELSRLLKEVVDGRLPEDSSREMADEQRCGLARLDALIKEFGIDLQIGEIKNKGLKRKVIKKSGQWAGLHATETLTTPVQRRWAALFLALRLFHRYWKRREEDPEECRILHPADFWFAWFPAPRNPAILPWHEDGDASQAWGNEFGRAEDRQNMNIEELLGQQKVANEESAADAGVAGLSPLEKRVLDQEARDLYGGEESLLDDFVVCQFLRRNMRRTRKIGTEAGSGS